MCVFSLYFKALDRKGVCKVFQNNFSACLFDNWQQFKSILRKKRNKLSLKTIDLLIPNHVYIDGWMGVFVCMWTDTEHKVIHAAFHAHLPRLEGRVSAVIQPSFLLGNDPFSLKLSFSLPLPSLQTLPQIPGLRFAKTAIRKVALHPKVTGKWKLHQQGHTHTQTLEIPSGWMNMHGGVCVLGLNIHCVCVCVCVHSSNCKKGTIFLSILRYNVIRNSSVQGKGFLWILSQHCGGKIRKWVHLSAVTTVNFIENTRAQMSGLRTCAC